MGVSKENVTPRLPVPFPINTSARTNDEHSFLNPDPGHKNSFSHPARIEFGSIGTSEHSNKFIGAWQPLSPYPDFFPAPGSIIHVEKIFLTKKYKHICKILSSFFTPIIRYFLGGILIRFPLVPQSLFLPLLVPVFPLVNKKSLCHDTGKAQNQKR